MTEKEERLWAAGCHLAALAGYFIPIIGNILGPLIVWMLARDKSPFINEQGKESINFQITMSIAAFVAFLLIFVAVGVFLMPIIALVDLILIIIAAVTVYQGKAYRYPFSLRLLK